MEILELIAAKELMRKGVAVLRRKGLRDGGVKSTIRSESRKKVTN